MGGGGGGGGGGGLPGMVPGEEALAHKGVCACVCVRVLVCMVVRVPLGLVRPTQH